MSRIIVSTTTIDPFFLRFKIASHKKQLCFISFALAHFVLGNEGDKGYLADVHPKVQKTIDFILWLFSSKIPHNRTIHTYIHTNMPDLHIPR